MVVALISQPWNRVVPSAEAGSLTVWNYQVARRLAPRARVAIYAARGRGQSGREWQEGIEYRRMSPLADRGLLRLLKRLPRPGGAPLFGSSLYYASYIRQIARDLRRSPAGVIHVHNLSQFVPILRELHPGSKIVLHMHCEWLTQLDRALIEPRLRQADLILGCSDFIIEKIRRAFPGLADRCRTLHNGVEIDLPDGPPPDGPPPGGPSPGGLPPGGLPPGGLPLGGLPLGGLPPGGLPLGGLPLGGLPLGGLPLGDPPPSGAGPDGPREPAPSRRDGAFRLLCIGRVSPEKGVHVLIEALPAVLARHPRARLEIVGPFGSMPREFLVGLDDDPQLAGILRFYRREPGFRYDAWLRERVAALGLERVVDFRGSLPHVEVIRILGQADLLVFPSVWNEPFGMPVIEAMAARVPVVATRGGGVPEIVEDGRTGRLVERGDPAALSAAILQLLDDEELRRSLAAAARRQVEERFTWERVVERLLRAYGGLPETPGSGRANSA